MEKWDKLLTYLEQIIIHAHDESKLSSIGDVELAYYLLTYNWQGHFIHMEIDMECHIQERIVQIGLQQPFLKKWIEAVLDIAEGIALSEESPEVLLIFSCQEEKLFVEFEMSGQWQVVEGAKRLTALQEIVAQEEGKLEFNILDEQEIKVKIEA